MIPRSLQFKDKQNISNNLSNDLYSLSLNTSTSSNLSNYTDDQAKDAIWWLSFALTPANVINHPQVHHHIQIHDHWVSICHLIKHTSFLNKNKPLGGQQQLIAHYVKKFPEFGLECILDNDKGICLRSKNIEFTQVELDQFKVYIQGLPSNLSDYSDLVSYLKSRISSSIQAVELPVLRSANSSNNKANLLGTYKRMVFVTLSDMESVSTVLICYGSFFEETYNSNDNLTSPRWNELKDQYLAFSAKLKSENRLRKTRLETGNSNQTKHITSSNSQLDYPEGCVLEITDLDPLMNKPTLRSNLIEVVDENDIAYIEYVKAIGTAIVRFANTKSAVTAQKAIGGVLLTGTRETSYWKNIPERLRMQALEKACPEIASTNISKFQSPEHYEQVDKKRHRNK
ncbi:hypothetical protein E3Q06_03603 [Wallemia mellicola]|uniref:La-related protein 7 homolog xRRM domain-containing protein n=1 Tax=Wallemia mellicola TaxID=1708541 RepID=A0AB38MHC5_9BASI|nr:hypothetical protein E3Q24_03463 [Wallemia mellicola]TIB80787.1 hypothetical protein E3Q21_03607 [Wallemia mellicola]TIB84863.1 hypothetical protein E3Q20_03521 [Wallemia mellicola]TIC21299.1 hypothetical protein E3Q12_03551 [Wallemia mellicola]TIC32880.1 hypothetical protein E3Q09_03567 [Wallemia mellicola]